MYQKMIYAYFALVCVLIILRQAFVRRNARAKRTVTLVFNKTAKKKILSTKNSDILTKTRLNKENNMQQGSR